MNLDELAQNIRAISSECVVQKLADILIEWKSNPETAEELRSKIERYIGNIWVKKDEDHSKIYKLWENFRNEAIGGIGGMTMNERLYWFGLFERFDAAQNKAQKEVIYRKLHATL